MKKLWKRIVMLGALVGCMATAAWAGNVEVKITDPLHGVVSINKLADGFYLMTEENTGSSYTEYKYHFDKNGRVAWKEDNVATITVSPFRRITYYTYDTNGNVIKEVSSRKINGVEQKNLVEYSYDEQGRIQTYSSLLKPLYTTSESSYSMIEATYFYEKDRVVCKMMDVVSEGAGRQNTTEKLKEYELDENGKIKKEIWYELDKGEKVPDGYVTDYSYDENNNLVEYVKTNGADAHEYLFSYDESGRCIKQEYKFNEKTIRTEEYQYDEYGNIIDDYCTIEKLSPVQDDSAFTDVTDKNGFAYDAIIWATEMGITKGTTETTFSPRAQCTRAQMVTFLWRAAGSPEPKTTENPFTDVKEGAYYKAILWAVENGITKGTSADKFSPNAKCTRGQIVTFIYRAAGEPEVETDENPFQDVKGGAYYDAILWAVENGITNGTTATTFSPNTICNRGQGVTFLYRGIGLY